MPGFNQVICALLFSILLSSCANQHEHASTPSAGAKGIAGANGTFEFRPADWHQAEVSWWKDSDGIEPGEAGCHIGTEETGKPNGRMFGEACLENGLLVESNPGKNELHSHKNDTGHPDTVDCNAWCVSLGKVSGSCEVAEAPPCTSSAICACE